VKKIGGSEYLLAPAWAVLAGMTGLAPYTAWVRELEGGNGFLARVEVRRIADGTVISAAEQLCTRSESKWARAEDHALLGMAQTRASSRALRGPLAQIVELAGYQGTPFEEMPQDVVREPDPGNPAGPADAPRSPLPAEAAPTTEQRARLRELVAELGELDPDTDWPARCRELVGVPGDMLTRGAAMGLIPRLEEERDELRMEEP
jgi:hypothetical protein